MDLLHRVAETKIREAIARGEFDDLPGSGRPLVLDDLSRVPPHLRVAYKVLRNANVLPPELELRRQLSAIEDEIDAASDESHLRALRRRHALTELNYRVMMERRLGAATAGPRPLRPAGLSSRAIARATRRVSRLV
jgi:hypothetical protein